MKKLQNNQYGLAPLLILLIILIIAAIVAVGWYVYTRDDEEPVGSTETSEESEDMSDHSFSGSYFDAISRGDALHCTWRAPEGTADEAQVGNGRFYTDGSSRGYSEGTFTMNGEQTTAYSIFNDDYVYSWFRLPGGQASGTRIARAELEADEADMTEAEQQQAMDIRARYSFDCQSWTVDEDLLTPPADVTFQDVAI